MPKSIPIVPEKVFARGRIHFTDIEINAYQRTIQDEAAVYSPRGLSRHLARHVRHPGVRDDSQRDQDEGRPTRASRTDHLGPAHLSIGQEAAAVGMAFLLTPDDHIYGSHRSHGEILAKGFSAIRKMSDAAPAGDHAVLPRRRDPLARGDGATTARVTRTGVQVPRLRRVQRDVRARDRASTAAWAARCTPSSHRSACYPNNAIVGGSGSIAPGAALFKRVNRKPGIVVANIGDASFGCGPVWEGITFASMDQYRKLWDPDARRRPAHHLQLHEQPLRHGRPAAGRDHGRASSSRGSAPASTPSRCTPNASTATIRCRSSTLSAARRTDPGAGPRAGAARHGHLPHQRPLALGRLQLPLEGRDRSVAAGGFARCLPRQAARRRRLVRERARRTRRARHRIRRLRDVQARRRPRSIAPRSPWIRSWSARSCSPTGAWRRCDDREPEFLGDLAAQPARAADPRQDPNAACTTASPCRR